MADGETIYDYTLGFYHTCVLTSSGRTFFFGANYEGAIGNDSYAHQHIPLDITARFNLGEGEKVIKAVAYKQSSMAFTSIGRVFVWGDGRYAQIGDGATTSRYVPIDITSRFDLNEGEEINFITIGGFNGYAITNQNRLFGWGTNNAQLGAYLPTNTVKPSVIRALSPKVFYKISFEVNGGSAVDEIEQEPGTSVTAPTAPTRNGYQFDGWYKDIGLTQVYSFQTMPEENISVYAKWSKITYSITYHLNGGTNFDSPPGTYDIETATILLGNSTKTGYTFHGWYDNETFEGNIITEIPLGSTGNKNLYAKWTVNQYTISFEENGGTVVENITQDYGTNLLPPANPTKTGYTFNGWYSNSQLTQYFSFSTMPASNITLYGKWSINQYKISFEENGGTIVEDVTQNFDSIVSAPIAPTKVGHTFGGWYEDQLLTNPYIFSKMPAADSIVYAKWSVNQYTISFEENGGTSVTDVTQDYDSLLNSPNEPTKVGYSFEGWYTNSNLTNPYTFQNMPAESLTLYAKWTPVSYPINYHLNGGLNAIQNPTFYNIETTTIALIQPTKTGYSFNGWYEDVAFNGSAITQILEGSVDELTLYAKWSINQYTISFDCKGGTTVSSLTQDYGTEIILPSNPTKEGYLFNGWNQSLPQTMPAQDLNLIAFWLKVEEVKEGIEADIEGLYEAVDPSLTSGKDIDLTLMITKKEENEILDTEKTSIQNIINATNEYKKQGIVFLNIVVLLQETGFDDYILENLDSSITITLAIPEEHIGYQNYAVVRIHQGIAELLETEHNEANNTLTFETDRFSTYSIVYDMYSGSGLWWLLLLLLIPLGYFGYRYKEKIRVFITHINHKIIKKENK